jgi:enolase-phosphatase E1
LGVAPEQILFVSDVTEELEAADKAGMKTLLSVRPGNAVQDNVKGYTEIRGFDEL